MSAPAHTEASDGPLAVLSRLAGLLARAQAYVGPALVLLLGAVALGRSPVDVDESATIAAARGSLSDVVGAAFENDPARVGYLALLQPVVAWSDDELWVRLPSVLAVVVAAYAIYRLGRRLVDARVGLVASVVLASSLGTMTIARSVGPLALALAAMLVSTALFAKAIESGRLVWWALYVVTTAALPLTHPIAASALGAQLVAIGFARRDVDLRVALPAVGIATLECGLFLGAAVVDRADAVDGAGPLALDEIGIGVGRALGWSPIVAAIAVWGFVHLSTRVAHGLARWKLALVAGLTGAPLACVLVAGAALPVYPREALTVAIGGIALAAGAGLVAITDRSLRLATVGAVVVVAIVSLVTVARGERQQEWREAATAARELASGSDSVVVVPPRARFAFEYYAPEIDVLPVGRGTAVTVVIVGDHARAVAAAREVVSPPRYALLEQREVSSRLTVQRWVRPGS